MAVWVVGAWRCAAAFASLGRDEVAARVGTRVTNDGWEYSNEGDLDPDLTEEAGYAYWDPPTRRFWTPTVLRIGAALVIALLVGGLVLAVIN